MKNKKHFPNGFYSWQETHFHIVYNITDSIESDLPSDIILQRRKKEGIGGVCELAAELTDQFEQLHEGREWDGEFYDAIYQFLEENVFTDNSPMIPTLSHQLNQEINA